MCIVRLRNMSKVVLLQLDQFFFLIFVLNYLKETKKYIKFKKILLGKLLTLDNITMHTR